jgi:hypothetical protein
MELRYLELPSLLLVLGLLIGCGQSYIHSNDGENKISTKKVFGTWQVNDHKALPVTAMDHETIMSLVGENLSISKDNFRFKGTSCDDTSYQYEYVENPDQYLEGFKISRDYLDIDSETMHVINVDCDNINIPGSSLFLLPNKEKNLLYHGDGVFFYIEKVREKGWMYSLW